jgi:electron transfer flavoprotein beta subunit
MKIAVIIKRVPDTASLIKIGGDGKSIAMDGLKYVLSPYDEHAVEQAMLIKEGKAGAGAGADVIVVTAGGEDCKETMRIALAMGADSGILVKEPKLASASSKNVAIALAASLKTLQPDLIFAGKQAVDDDASQVGERVAEILGIAHVSTVTAFKLADAKATITREIEGGTYNMEVSLPALFTAQKGLNAPRYPTLPNIMKAKKKEIKDMTLAELGLTDANTGSQLEIVSLETPKPRSAGKILDGDSTGKVTQLIKALHEVHKAF